MRHVLIVAYIRMIPQEPMTYTVCGYNNDGVARLKCFVTIVFIYLHRDPTVGNSIVCHGLPITFGQLCILLEPLPVQSVIYSITVSEYPYSVRHYTTSYSKFWQVSPRCKKLAPLRR